MLDIMKIYFDGCSWTAGGELSNPKKHRYSKVLCEKLEAEEHNIARSGSSNDRIVRNLLIENNIEEYDLAVIQMTFPARFEIYNGGRWRNVNYSGVIHDIRIGKEPDKSKALWRTPFADFWMQFYREVYHPIMGQTNEHINYITIKNHCKVHNVPLIIATCLGKEGDPFHTRDRFEGPSVLEYDLNMAHIKYPRKPLGHPDEEGHRMIAEDLYKLCKK